MRRAKKVAVPEEEEEEEFEFDEDMDGMEDDMHGMTLEEILSPEEIEMLVKLIDAVIRDDTEECKKILAGTSS